MIAMLSGSARITPYYEDEWATIYHGDCLATMLGMEPFADVIVTDPPYGTRTDQRNEWMVGEFANVIPLALPEMYRLGVSNAALYAFTSWMWQADWTMRASSFFRQQGFIVWDKGRHSGTYGKYSWQFHWEGIYFGIKGPRAIREYLPDVIRGRDPGKALPMQKPVTVIEKLIRASSDEDQVVFDPFMGSGSTLVAAKNLRRKAVGIEIEERYCEVAARRLSQEVLDLGA